MAPKAKPKVQEGVIEVDENHIRPGPRMVWSELQSTNAVGGRVHHHAVLFDGKLITIGGWSGVQRGTNSLLGHAKDLTYFDFSTNQWNSILSVEGPHHPGTSQCSMVDHQGNLYFFGGWTGKARTNAVSLLNLEAMQWSPVPTADPPAPVSFHSATLSNRRMYIFGGNTIEGQSSDMYFLDLNTKNWSRAAPLGAPSKRSSHSAALITDTLIVVFGGRGGSEGTQALNDVALFETSNNQWLIGVKVDGAPPPRYGHCAVSMKNKMLIFGGVGDQGQLLNDAWLLELEKPNLLVWSRIQQDGPIPCPRAGHCALESMSSMYIVGGRTDSHGKTASDLYSLDLGAIAPVPSTAGTIMSEADSEAKTATSG